MRIESHQGLPRGVTGNARARARGEEELARASPARAGEVAQLTAERLRLLHRYDTKVARARGETEQRLYLVSAWREAPCYSERERAALEWTEALTLLSRTGASDDAYEPVSRAFSQEEIVALTLAIVTINGWNRFAVGLRTPVGNYRVSTREGRPEPEHASDTAGAPHSSFG